MRTKRSQVVYNTKTFLSPKLAKHNKLHQLRTTLYQNYCVITGFLRMLPDFYIIGGQKCGTTSLYVYLTQHPLIKAPIAKDIRFFDKYFNKGINWYRSYFPFKTQKKFLTGEATERYLEHPYAPKRIKQVTPNAKFIVLLRNPVDRAYSHYLMIVKHDQENQPFEDVIIKEKEKIKEYYNKMLNDENYYNDLYFRHGYLDRGIYVDKLKRWMSVFPKKQFLIIQSEEFFRNPSEIYNQVLEFLELPKLELGEYKQYRKQDYTKSDIDSSLRKQLEEYFEPHNQRLYEFLGRRFNWNR